jgi:hypothetical protein
MADRQAREIELHASSEELHADQMPCRSVFLLAQDSSGGIGE